MAMKLKPAALLAILPLLAACVATPSQYARDVGVNPATDCRVFPITQHMWRDAYPGLLNAQVDPDWMYPVYAGLGTTTWLVATPFLPLVDLLVAPLWMGQGCTWDNTWQDIQKVPG